MLSFNEIALKSYLNAYGEGQKEQERSAPRCAICGEPIEDDDCYHVEDWKEDGCIHLSCLKKSVREIRESLPNDKRWLLDVMADYFTEDTFKSTPVMEGEF